MKSTNAQNAEVAEVQFAQTNNTPVPALFAPKVSTVMLQMEIEPVAEYLRKKALAEGAQFTTFAGTESFCRVATWKDGMTDKKQAFVMMPNLNAAGDGPNTQLMQRILEQGGFAEKLQIHVVHGALNVAAPTSEEDGNNVFARQQNYREERQHNGGAFRPNKNSKKYSGSQYSY